MKKVWRTDQLFPPLLQEIRDPPPILYCMGQELIPTDKYFAIVGTRRPSQYGKQMASEFAFAIAKTGFVIVSGLAYGIDAIAHKSALMAGSRTIAVLGSGLKHITPTCNLQLAKEIQNSGTIITEFPEDMTPTKGTFPQRNRIIAGMSCATLVIEAPERSGALITARFALEYNRDVFAVPGNLTQETSTGANRLIRDCKAFPVTCLNDIFAHLGTSYLEESRNGTSNPNPLTNEEKTVFDLIKNAPIQIDELIAETKFPASQINTILSMLELKGLVKITGAYVFVTR